MSKEGSCFLEDLITILNGIKDGTFNTDEQKMDELLGVVKRTFLKGKMLQCVMKAIGESVRRHASSSDNMLSESENVQFEEIVDELMLLSNNPDERELKKVERGMSPLAMQGIRRSLGLKCFHKCYHGY